MNIEENDDQMVDTSLLPDFSLLGIEEDPIEDVKDDEPVVVEPEEEETPTVTTVEPEETPAVEVTPETEEEVAAIANFYQLFQEKGILPEKDIKSWEDLESEIEAYKTDLPTKVKESIISSATEEAQGVVNYALTKPNVTKEQLIEYLQAEQHDASVASIDTDEKAREYLKTHYTATISDEDVLNNMLDTMEDKGSLQGEAKRVSENQSAKLTEQATADAERQATLDKEHFETITNEFNAQPWKDDHREKVVEQFRSGELDRRVAQIISDPKSLVQLANILSYYDAEKSTFNLDTFFTQATTKKTTSVRDSIIASSQNVSSSTKNTKSPSKGFDLSQYEMVN